MALDGRAAAACVIGDVIGGQGGQGADAIGVAAHDARAGDDDFLDGRLFRGLRENGRSAAGEQGRTPSSRSTQPAAAARPN